MKVNLMKSCFETHQERVMALNNVDLYPVISSEFCNGRSVEEVFEKIALGGAKMIQIREKNRLKGEIFSIAKNCRKIANEFGILLIINDHIDVAMAVDADGVHLGQDDLPLIDARRIAPNLILGHSTHDLDEALFANNNGADYLNIGPIYQTQTKALTYKSLGIEAITEIKQSLSIPFTVMGGIKEKHLSDLIAAGAKHIAMVTEITQSEDITNQVKKLRSYWK